MAAAIPPDKVLVRSSPLVVVPFAVDGSADRYLGEYLGEKISQNTGVDILALSFSSFAAH
jgi:hypothetical protein